MQHSHRITGVARSVLFLASLSACSLLPWPVLRGGEGERELPEVRVLRIPEEGYQPRAAVGRDGSVHVIWLAGEPAAANIFYAPWDGESETLGKAVRVNRFGGSAVALGNVRGPGVAVGRKGRVHVAWMGSGGAKPRGPEGETPLLYTSLDPESGTFDVERNVIRERVGLDGGGTVAADDSGNVWVVWHAPRDEGAKEGEGARRVWIARSKDDGATFAVERSASPPLGACACCGISAFARREGEVFALWRTARELVHRDIYLLASSDGGESFAPVEIDPWEVPACVMSTSSFFDAKEGVLIAWETRKQVYWARASKSTGEAWSRSDPVSAPGGSGDRRFPVIARDRNGFVLLAWTEGMRWGRGGVLAWQVFDPDGKVIEDAAGRGTAVSAWSLVAAFPRPKGGFVILH